MLKYIAEKMNRTTITLEEIKEWTDYHEEINDGDYIYIHEFEVVP